MALTVNNKQVTSAEFALHQFRQASASGKEDRVCRAVENIEHAAAVISIKPPHDKPHDCTTRYEFWDGSVLLIHHAGDDLRVAEIVDSVEPRNKPY
jgi:hypothetical protein